MVKGIMSADDARQCIEHGVDGIIVSNHGAANSTAFRPRLKSSLRLPTRSADGLKCCLTAESAGEAMP